MSFSFFFRLMDHWGLPRSFVTEGVGGEGGGPADRRLLFGRFVRKSPRLVRLQIRNLAVIARIRREFSRLDSDIATASGLADLHRACAEGLGLALRTNFAINGALVGVTRVRRSLGIRGAARVVTQEMMEEYSRLAVISDPAARESALDAWLTRYGHRGPLESDPARPRFAEIREVLLQDLAATAGSPPIAGQVRSRPGLFARPWFLLDEIRERFRDELMRRWQRLRTASLEEGRRLAAAGELDAPEDVFFLRRADLESEIPLRDTAMAGRDRVARAAALDLPLTGSRDEIRRQSAESNGPRPPPKAGASSPESPSAPPSWKAGP